MNILKMKQRAAGMLRYQEENGGEGGEGGGSGLSAEEIAEYRQMKADKIKAEEDAKNNPPKSAFDKIKEQEEQDRKKQQSFNDVKSVVQFDLNFDKTIAENKSLFSMNAETIRSAGKNLEGKELVHHLRCTAVKDFFSKDSNLDALSGSERTFIENNVKGQHDNNIDSNEAWRILENGLHIAKRLEHADKSRGTGGGSSEETPKLNAFIDNAKNRVRGIKATI